MRKLPWVLAVLAIGIMMTASACAQASDAATEDDTVRIEVSRKGFNGMSDFSIEVEEGEEVEITFVYGDADFPQNNPHMIEFLGLGIKTGILDRDHREETVRFTAGEAGEISFRCTLTECVGHANLMKGMMDIGEEGHGHAAEEQHD